MATHINQPKKGDCECCPKTDQTLTLYMTMWMCPDCLESEKRLVAESQKPENQQARVNAVNSLMQQSKQIDSSIQVKTDLFNAATVASVELKAAIDHDESIAADQKQYAYANACLERFQHFQKIVFDQRQELLETENKMRMWQTQVQQAAATLRAELREKFKQFDVNYQPAAPKTPKPAAPKTGKKFQKEDVRKYSAQYKVPEAAVQMLVVAKNMTPEAAAKHLAIQMGLFKE
jgi:hypothetical protein